MTNSAQEPRFTPGHQLFAALEMEPTADARTLKRAYFAALHRHPPHNDPEGFRRLRAAYEELLTPGRLGAAFLTTCPDLDVEWQRCQERFAEPLAQCVDRGARQASVAAIIDRLARRRFDALP
jgi:hypothetical protein